MYNGERVVITYGTYDLLHFGHIALMQRGKELGDFLIVGVTSDAFDRTRGKLSVYQPLNERLEAVKNTGIPDMVFVEEYKAQKMPISFSMVLIPLLSAPTGKVILTI